MNDVFNPEILSQNTEQTSDIQETKEVAKEAPEGNEQETETVTQES